MEQAAVVILFVEDEELVALATKEALEDGGFAVRHLVSGAEALAAVDDGKTIYSGLVTDIRLGQGPDGWDVARHAREVNPTIPVVYMSGDSAHEHSSYGVPDSIMLQKPFAATQLLTAISTLMNAVPSHNPE